MANLQNPLIPDDDDYQQDDITIPYPYERPLEVDKDPVLSKLEKMIKLLEKIAGLPVILQVQEAVLTPGQSVVFTFDSTFDHWCIYNTCDSGGFVRIGPNSTSVPLLGSLFLGRNGKVIFPATQKQTSVTNPSSVDVDVFAVIFNRTFDIFF